MSISSINSTVSGLTQAMQMQQKVPEPPLKDEVDSMNEEDRSEFNSKIESFTQDQMMYFMSLMLSNESEISEMSEEEATAAIFELMDEASGIESLSELEGLSALDALEENTPPPPGGMPPPPPPSEEAQDPLVSLSDEDMSVLVETFSTMSNEQKQEFGFLLMESKEELASLSAEEASEMVLALLEESSIVTTNTSTQNAMSNFTRGGSFLDIYS